MAKGERFECSFIHHILNSLVKMITLYRKFHRCTNSRYVDGISGMSMSFEGVPSAFHLLHSLLPLAAMPPRAVPCENVATVLKTISSFDEFRVSKFNATVHVA